MSWVIFYFFFSRVILDPSTGFSSSPFMRWGAEPDFLLRWLGGFGVLLLLIIFVSSGLGGFEGTGDEDGDLRWRGVGRRGRPTIRRSSSSILLKLGWRQRNREIGKS